jgi:hypothetical protein
MLTATYSRPIIQGMINLLPAGLVIMGTGLAFWLFQKLITEQRPSEEDLERQRHWEEEEDKRKQDE